MFSARTKLTAAAVAAALISSSAATAATTTAAPVPAPVAQTSQASWLTLSMLTPAGAIGLGGAVAQDAAADNPPPPPPANYNGGPSFPPLPVIAILLGTVALAIYIATRDKHGRVELPNSAV